MGRTRSPLLATSHAQGGTVHDVQSGGRTRRKLREWIRRYLACEIAGTVGELGGAAVAYLATGSLAAAAIAATIGGRSATTRLPTSARCAGAIETSTIGDGWSNLLALRSVAVEFGPAELIDSVAVRPVAFYVGPQIFDNTIAGWIFGKLVSDLAFYLCAISSYERFKSLLVRAEPRA